MESKHKKSKSTNLLKNSFLTIAGLAVLGIGLWALMYYSTPNSNLQSYASYKESNKKPEIKKNNGINTSHWRSKANGLLTTISGL